MQRETLEASVLATVRSLRRQLRAQPAEGDGGNPVLVASLDRSALNDASAALVAERAAAGPPASGSGTRGGESIWGSHSSEAQWLLEQKLGQKDAMETIGEDTRPWTPPDTARWTPPDGEMDQAF